MLMPHGVVTRRIEQLTHENLSVRYLCANTHPDHDTIAKFRRENAALFQDCMRAIILLGQELRMVKLGMRSRRWDAITASMLIGISSGPESSRAGTNEA